MMATNVVLFVNPPHLKRENSNSNFFRAVSAMETSKSISSNYKRNPNKKHVHRHEVARS